MNLDPEMLRLLRRIARSKRPGAVLRKLLRPVDRRARARRRAASAEVVEAYQRPLRVIQPRAPSASLLETDRVPCRMGGMLLVRACLVLRSRTWPSGKRKGRPMRLECIDCPLGVEYAKRLPGFVPPPQSQPAEVLPPQQRAAKARYAATHVRGELQLGLDPLDEAASLTPDDRPDWRA